MEGQRERRLKYGIVLSGLQEWLELSADEIEVERQEEWAWSQVGLDLQESGQNMRVCVFMCVRVCVCELQQSPGEKYLSRQFGTKDVTVLHALQHH